MNARGAETQPPVAPRAVDVQEDPGPAMADLAAVEARVDGVLVLPAEVGQPLGGVRARTSATSGIRPGTCCGSGCRSATGCPDPEVAAADLAVGQVPGLRATVCAEGAEQSVGAKGCGARSLLAAGPDHQAAVTDATVPDLLDLLPTTADPSPEHHSRVPAARAVHGDHLGGAGLELHGDAVERTVAPPQRARARGWSARGTGSERALRVRREVTSVHSRSEGLRSVRTPRYAGCRSRPSVVSRRYCTSTTISG